MKWIGLVDHYGVNSVVLTLAAFEVIAFCHCYGVKRICGDVTFMLGQAPSKFYQICWKYITPTLLVGLIIGFLVQDNDMSAYTTAENAVGRSLTALFIAPFPLYMIYKIYTQKADTLVEVKKKINVQISFINFIVLFFYFCRKSGLLLPPKKAGALFYQKTDDFVVSIIKKLIF